MARCRFVQPNVTRLTLSDGDFIDIKHELNAGEERAAFDRMVRSLVSGALPQLDPKQVELATLVEYIVGWSFTDAQGQPVAVSEDAIKSLDSQTFSEMYKAIEVHEATVEAGKKTATTVAPASSAT